MKVFLTGGTGFIGQPLTKALLRRGWEVTALVRKPDSPQAHDIKRIGAELVVGDVTLSETIRSPMSGADIVVHNAGRYEYGLDSQEKQRMRTVNVDGTENVLGLAEELHIPRTIYVSTIQAFGDTGLNPCDENFIRQVPCRTTYEQTKTDAHKIACQYRERGLPLIIVCPHGVIGPNDHSVFGYFVRLYVNHRLPPIGWAPDSIFCLVEVNDLAEGIALAAEKGHIGETYFLCGEPRNFREIFEYWSKKPGGYAPRLWLPDGLMAAMVAPMEPVERMLGLPAFLSRETVRGGATQWNYCHEKAERELGWMHCSPEAMWDNTFEGEIQLLSKRKTQKLIQRLIPLDTVD